MDIVPEKIPFDFDLHIEGLTREQAERLLDIITNAVELAGGHLGGGLVEAPETSLDPLPEGNAFLRKGE